MLFGSEIFLLWFFPVTLGLYVLCPHRFRNLFLVLASYFFYGWWDLFSLGLMILATIINYGAGRLIGGARSEKRRRMFLTLAIVINLSLLCLFKYEVMLADAINVIAGKGIVPVIDLLLPIGISFYIFEGISYCIDCARGGNRAKSFFEFACYLSLFPHVLAGPIIRFHELSDQLRSRTQSWEMGAEGCYRFAVGLAKKILIADTMAAIADPLFAGVPSSMLGAWVGVTAYTLQIYFDFSGYSDMAIGLALMFGFRFPENFALPYFSKNITEFWRRWHMTLSSWFRDYVYVSLGGNKHCLWRTVRNLFLTMLLAGWWHGANWTFVVWGMYFGALLGIERILYPHRILQRLPAALQWALTMFLVMMGWVLFRSQSFAQATGYYRALFSWDGAGTVGTFALGAVVAGVLAAALEKFLPLKPRFSLSLALGCSAIFVVCLLVIFGDNASPFIYFQF